MNKTHNQPLHVIARRLAPHERQHYVSVSKEKAYMRMTIIVAYLSLALLSLTSCSTLSPRFSTENIMKVHQGMGSEEILTLFGEPKNVRVAVCGRSPDQWTCTTWEYGEFPNVRASFTFSGEHDSLKLNNFNVDRN